MTKSQALTVMLSAPVPVAPAVSSARVPMSSTIGFSYGFFTFGAASVTGLASSFSAMTADGTSRPHPSHGTARNASTSTGW